MIDNLYVDESFDNGLAMFNHVWGNVDASISGQITVTSPANTHENASAMVRPTGVDTEFGYGYYEFTLSTSSDTIGPYALLWPGSDHWPGPEIDVFELGGSNDNHSMSRPYSTVHFNENGHDNFSYKLMPEGIDPTKPNTYAVKWDDYGVTFSVNGNEYHTETEHAPKDYAHGGEDAVPSIGEQTGWWPDQNTSDNSLTLYHFAYSPIG